jgi:anaerobic selenocysteine-containing dehydrogenase
MRLIATFTALLALAYAAPSVDLEKTSLDKRQQGENCVVCMPQCPFAYRVRTGRTEGTPASSADVFLGSFLP